MNNDHDPIPVFLNSHIRDQLRQRRRDLGLKMERLAERLGVCRATIGHWETGWAWPASDRLAEWASELGYEIDVSLRAPQKRHEEPQPPEYQI